MADRQSEMARWVRPVVALVFLVAGTFVAQFGLIDLIAAGYGTLTLLIIAVYVIPVLTVGVWKIRTHPGPGPRGSGPEAPPPTE